MKFKSSWLITLIALIAVVGGSYLFINNSQVRAQTSGAANSVDVGTLATVQVQPASALSNEVSAAGHIELVNEQVVAAEVNGVVDGIAVKTGDQVQAGDLLLVLDTEALERSVKRAELAVESSRNALAELTEDADAADIAVAQANLAEAEENLADVLAGPSDAEIAAAQSSLNSAWAKYNELQAGPSEDELTQLSADLKKKEVALAEAQRAYDQIAWRNDVGMTQEAANLQQATIDYEAAQAAYGESTADADTSDLQSAISSAQNAQVQLNELLDSPTEAEVAAAQANVVDAQAKLDELLNGADETDLRNAQIALEQSLIDLEESTANLLAASITAPIDGTVLTVNTEVGERINQGTAIITLADTTQLELTIDVAEVDVVQVSQGQSVQVEIDALSGSQIAGMVDYIAPASDDASGVVNYPVTIRLTAETLANVRPGMTAVATIANTASVADNSWLVPTTAIQTTGKQARVQVVRGETLQTIEVHPGTIQGEWTVVQASELQVGDEVVGSVASYLDSDEDEFTGPRGSGGGNGPFRG